MNKSSKSLIATLVFVSSASLLVGCANSPAMPEVDTPVTVIEMATTPNVGELGISIDESLIPEGFSTSLSNSARGIPSEGEGDPDKIAQQQDSPVSTTSYSSFSEATQCNITYNASFHPGATVAGWGDQYATVSVLQGQIGNGLINNKENSVFDIGNGLALEGIQAESTLIVGGPPPVIPPEGTEPDTGGQEGTGEATPGTQTFHALTWTRAFDALQENKTISPLPLPEGVTPDANAGKVIPYIAINYSCRGNTPPNADVFQQAVEALTVTGITVK